MIQTPPQDFELHLEIALRYLNDNCEHEVAVCRDKEMTETVLFETKVSEV